MSDPGSSMIDEFREEIDPIVFAFGALLTVGVIAAFFISPSAVENGISSLNNQLLGAFNWAMMLIVFLIVLFLLFLIVGPWGGIKFGDEPPSTVFSPFSRCCTPRGSRPASCSGADRGAVLLQQPLTALQ